MTTYRVHFILISFLSWIYIFECFQFIPERASVSYVNQKYITDVIVNVRRFGRRSPYYVNVMGCTKYTWNNNVTVEMNVLQLLHNEFRTSFVRVTRKLCDLVNNDPFVGGAVRRGGLECPVKPGCHALMNMTASTENFPNVFPFEKGRVDLNLSVTDTAEPIVQYSIVATFKEKLG